MLLIYRLACSSEPERWAVSSGLQQKRRQRGEAEVGQEIFSEISWLVGSDPRGSLCQQE